MKINFDGGDLSSDAGLLLVKEFACKLGFDKILKSEFKTNDPAMFRIHKDDENLWLPSQRYRGFSTGWMTPLSASPMTLCARRAGLYMPLKKQNLMEFVCGCGKILALNNSTIGI